MNPSYFDENEWIKKALEDTDIGALAGIIRGLKDVDEGNAPVAQQYAQGLLPMPQKENTGIPPIQTSNGLLGDITNGEQAKVPEPPQQLETPTPIQTKYEQEPDAKTTIDKETLNAARNGNPPTAQILNNNALPTNNQLQIDKSGNPPNPVYNELVNTLAYAKLLYENAPQGEQGDAQREIATRTAQMARQQAEALGIDISRFGADNANAADMYNNAYTQRLQDVANIMKGGKFHETADEFYRRKYLSHMGNKSDDIKDIISGIFGIGSSDTAKMLAQEEAKQYQANRVAYLDGMLNAYGLDGNKGLNRFGHEIAGMLLKEDPDLVNMYLQRYSNADARNMLLEDKAIESRNKREEKYINQAYKLQEMQIRNAFEMAQLQYGGNIDLIKSFVAHQFNLSQAQVNALYQDWINDRQAERGRETYAANKAVDQSDRIAGEERALQMADRKVQRQIDLIKKVLPPDEQGAAIANIFGVGSILYGNKGSSSTKGNGQNKDVEYWNDLIGKLTGHRNSIIAPYKNEMGMSEIPEDVKAQIDDIDEFIAALRDRVFDSTGGGDSQGIREYTGDDSIDTTTLEQLKQLAGGSNNKYLEFVGKWCDESGLTERVKNEILAREKARIRNEH